MLLYAFLVRNLSMRIILAPMEGVLDPPLRDLLTQIGGFDHAVTEFVRVVDMLLPDHVFYKLCPELHHAGKTSNGTPVRVQLLGSDPEALARNAQRAIELGSPGIDLNFGCPAKTVNRSNGGAILLKDTQVLYNITQAVRQAVPKQYPVTAKMRLGFEDDQLALDNALALEAAGADELAVHARTKTQGYKPPAYWEKVKPLSEQLSIPVIANGEIWNQQQAQLCQLRSGCQDIMIGRGALTIPNLAQVIRLQQSIMPWPQVLALLLTYADYPLSQQLKGYYPNRVKQWLKYLVGYYPQAQQTFELVKRQRQRECIAQILNEQLNELAVNE